MICDRDDLLCIVRNGEYEERIRADCNSLFYIVLI